jgi:tRNA threonylcarbamoyladenosine biosynthesis protein TsaE
LPYSVNFIRIYIMKYSNLTLAEVENLALVVSKKVSDKGLTVGLIGNLGSGKTTFTKKALGIKSIKSPTFIVSQQYPFGKRFLYHLDFYRLDHPNQLLPLGLDEILSSNNIVVIEWVDKFPQIARKCDILINLTVKPNNKRDVSINNN